MSTTTELRWFYPGLLPAAVMDWFDQESLGQYVGAWETREDHYLVVPECSYLNLKLRADRLEVKLRQEQFAVQRCGNRWSGLVERWTKWGCSSMDTQHDDLHFNSDQPDQHWIGVEKQRSQRQYQVVPNQDPRSLPLEKVISQGCSVEITQLKANDQDWWSLAFEAFGERSQQQQTLLAIASWCGQMSDSPTLAAEQSYAYPQWLMAILQ
ncbi:hypothetical protein IQ268_18170 [Oculatella sp. LEGE 06141]|uniref:hypothetical protein n=1 Tax=Oculatella sp. LEGE 06141 TaxID=1828648 RepID=UPI0018807D60|nr:hypothetical protein [Oculatella sp. LEGE 06141]MBE9180491.1 hypothetical protein [Oculatella sp. LEGE 06141]